MSIIINLYGSPGVGKSTLSADVFAKLKLKRKSTELTREYIKSWVWEKRNINAWDQIYIMANQIRSESILYKKVDYIVTDSPILLVPFYEFYLNGHEIVKPSALNFIKYAESQGVTYLNFWLEKLDEYEEIGRNQDQTEAIGLDKQMKQWLIDCGVNLIDLPKDHDERMKIIFKNLNIVL